MSGILIEVCTGSLADSIIACEAGADRIELNSALQLGGLSPSPGVLSKTVESVNTQVIAMVRPHPAGFTYSEMEKTAILRDVEIFLEGGAAGIATGALTVAGEVDTEFIAQLRKLVGNSHLVFHRAFDLIPDPFESASQLVDLGVDRILTSGGCKTAWEGRNTLKDLISRFGDQIEIIPGSGVNSTNAVSLVNCTGCSQIHGSFSNRIALTGSAAVVLTGEGIETNPFEIRKTIMSMESSMQL